MIAKHFTVVRDKYDNCIAVGTSLDAVNRVEQSADLVVDVVDQSEITRLSGLEHFTTEMNLIRAGVHPDSVIGRRFCPIPYSWSGKVLAQVAVKVECGWNERGMGGKDGCYQKEWTGRIASVQKPERFLHGPVCSVQRFVHVPRSGRPVVVHHTRPVVASCSFRLMSIHVAVIVVSDPVVFEMNVVEPLALVRGSLVHPASKPFRLVSGITQHTG